MRRSGGKSTRVDRMGSGAESSPGLRGSDDALTMALRSLLALFALIAAATAQNVLVVPASHELREGTTSTNVPFGRSAAVRSQQIYDAMLFSGPRSITGLSFRLDGMATAAGKQVDCEIRMSTCPLPLVATSASFAQNRGANEAVVLSRRIVSLPASSVSVQPSPFSPAIALDAPFAYDPAQGNLCVEIIVHAQPPGSYSLDATYACSSPEQAIGPAACQPLAGQPLRIESASTGILWGRPWLVRALDATPGALVLLALGGSETGSWNGAQLPVDLTSAGAPGCFVSIDIADTFFQLAAGDGTASFGFTVPNDPRLTGVWVRYQAGSLVNGANALGVVTSQAKKAEICGFEPVARVWSNGVGASDGLREIGTAPVISLVTQ